MGLLDLFNQWIVERGSAAVQEKHIALFRDQLAQADKRIVELESEITSLKGKLNNSQTTINQLTKENTELKKKNQISEKPSQSVPSLDDSKIKIISLLSKISDEKEIVTGYIASQCNLSLQATKFYLEELENDEMVSSSRYVDGTSTWSIDQEGRRYLHSRGLL